MPIVDNETDFQRYIDFVRNSPYAKPMQDPNWSKIKNNWTSDYVYLEENKQIIATLSVIGIKNTDGKHFLYAPRGPVCDFWDFDLVERLIKEAAPLKDKYDAFLLRIDPEILFNEKIIYEYQNRGYEFRTYPLTNHAFTQPRHNMVLDINFRDEDELLASFSTSCRRNIRKAYKNKLKTIHTKDLSEVDTFYELTKIMAERQGIGHRPKDYFQRLMEYMDGHIFTTYYNDKALSSSLLIPYNDKVYYLYAASSNENRELMPNYQMIWEEIKWTMKNDYRYFDFGGVFSLDIKDGLYRFKEGFTRSEGIYNFIGELDVVYDKEKYQEFIK